MSVIPELPKLISGNDNHYPNLGSGTSGSGNSGSGSGNSGTGNGYRVFCPGLPLLCPEIRLALRGETERVGEK
jgi:hypothetical protein